MNTEFNMNSMFNSTPEYMKEICALCLDEIDFYAEIKLKEVTLACNHIFHEVCIQGWLKIEINCPSCRLLGRKRLTAVCLEKPLKLKRVTTYADEKFAKRLKLSS